MAESDHSIHVLLVSYPAQGHINPLLQLAKRLAGHRASAAPRRDPVRPRQPGGPSAGAVHVAAFSDGCDRLGYDEVGDVQTFLALLESVGSSTLDELLRPSRSRAGWCTRSCTTRSCAGRRAWLGGTAPSARPSFVTQACAVTGVYAHAW
ncbi:hypothetical protein ZWY2020_022986 [Hordeum vulgare]|nr:hypothetical protein ZWY2020_022986 [Hordeum vulgare]